MLYTDNSGLFVASLTLTTQRQMPAIRAWKQYDPAVAESDLQVPGDGIFILSGKATNIGMGLWQYEYAGFNLNSDRAGGWFRVSLPLGASVSDVGFHDVNYHSGELWDSTDWTWDVTSSSITWTTVNYSENPNGNAIRWGTLYNFRFKTDVSPAVERVTLGLFKPGYPMWAQAEVLGPSVIIIDCNGNGIPDSIDIGDGASIDCNGNTVPDECETVAPCGDGNVCTCDYCVAGSCVHVPGNYGDVTCNGGLANLDDILCVLSGFSQFSRCPNGDLAPLSSGNGIINLDDILAVLAAFGGNNPC